MNENVIQFGHGRGLVGVYADAEGSGPLGAASQDQPTALILNAGIVHRSGPFRLHVDIARSLAALGYSSFRMDLSGLGDSAVRTDLPGGSDRATLDAKDAMEMLVEETGSTRFVVIGLCSGAYNGHNIAVGDDRVVGGVFLDGLVYRTQGFVRRKYVHRMTSMRFWRNALKRRRVEGALEQPGDDVPGAEEFFEAERSAEESACEIQQLLNRNAQLFYIYTQGYDDISSRSQFKEMFGMDPNAEELQVEYYDNFEHTYRLAQHRQTIVDRVSRWYAERFPVKRLELVSLPLS